MLRSKNMLKRMLVGFLLCLALAGQATAEWRVDYLKRSAAPGGTYYKDGSFMVLKYPSYAPVYALHGNWMYIGMEQVNTSPAMLQQFKVAVLPLDAPSIAFPEGIDMIILSPLGQ